VGIFPGIVLLTLYPKVEDPVGTLLPSVKDMSAPSQRIPRVMLDE
jgi:hypothetical protein